jgi:hypothetical protein
MMFKTMISVIPYPAAAVNIICIPLIMLLNLPAATQRAVTAVAGGARIHNSLDFSAVLALYTPFLKQHPWRLSGSR